MKAKSKKVLVQRLLIALLALGFTSFVLSGCKGDTRSDSVEDSKKMNEAAAVAAALASRDSMIEDLVLAFDEVDANLEVIRTKEENLRNWADGEEILGKREERIVRDIQVINTLMANNREEIASLRERLRKSGVNVAALETRLNHMEMANLEKTAQLEELKAQLASAETSLAGLNDTLSVREMRLVLQDQVISAQSDVILAQDSKLHEAYVATGSYKELKERGLVDKKGALLGIIGGEKTFTAKTDPEEFVMIDQREQLKIPVLSKKVELITPHPDGSYQLEHDEEGKVSAIEILNPGEFWQSSQYLIVATEQ
jgi:uncharacterized coiled-coil protein SlyX